MRPYQNETLKAESGERRTGSWRPSLSVPRHGFTLTELLVVITIMAILTGLVVAGAYTAIQRGKETSILTEIDQLSGAVEAFKEKHGAYPPNGVMNNGLMTMLISSLSRFKVLVRQKTLLLS